MEIVTLGLEFAEYVLHEFLEMLKCFVGKIHIVNTVDFVMPELNVIAERSAVEVPAPNRLDYIVGKICAGRYKHVDMPGFHEIGNDPAHTGQAPLLRQARRILSPDYRAAYVHKWLPLYDSAPPLYAPAFPIAITSSLTVIFGLTWSWVTGSSHCIVIFIPPGCC